MAFDLAQRGFKHVYALKGGWDAWLESGGKTGPKPAQPSSGSKKKQ